MLNEEFEKPEDILALVTAGNLDRIKLAVSDVDELRQEELLSCRDWSGDSLLAIASWQGHFHIAEWLILERKANVNDRNLTGTTPLHRACFHENLDIIRLLCNYGADLFAKDNSGKTPQDVGTSEVRKFIQERILVEKAIYEIKLSEFEEFDREWSRAQSLYLEQEYFNSIKNRCFEAQSMVITGAKVDVVKGKYIPLYGGIHCDWPVYVKESNDMILIYHSDEPDDYGLENKKPGEWLIMHRADMFPENLEGSLLVNTRQESYEKIFDPHMSYVRMECACATFPELRVEGHNGIIEYDTINGHFRPFDDDVSVLEILPEAFIEALKATEKLKLELRGGSVPIDN